MNNPSEFKITYKPFFYLFCFSFAAFLFNFFLIKNCISPQAVLQFKYSLPILYVIFFTFSFVILTLILIVRKANLDYVGYTYLILTSIKMGIAFFLLRPILATATNETSFEELNFFIVFIYFLTIETLITIRILNNKQ